MAKTGGSAGAKSWPFYVSGPVLALLVVLSLYLFNDSIGLGEAMTVASEHCVEGVQEQEWDALPLDWQMGLLLGVFLGALGTAVLSGKYKPQFSDVAGPVPLRIFMTPVYGIIGGFLMMTGIQLSGDSVFGQFAAAIQLSGGAWVFLIAMVITAVLLAVLLAQREGKAASGKGGK